jgi:hypothetical protein
MTAQSSTPLEPKPKPLEVFSVAELKKKSIPRTKGTRLAGEPYKTPVRHLPADSTEEMTKP